MEQEKIRRSRSFDERARQQCWQKADVVAGRHPDRWRKDPAGNIVCHKFTNCSGCLCHQYDHVRPFSRGGESDAGNCQILQSRVNLLKSDKQDLGKEDLEQYSCHLKFTDKELDIIEMAVYGNVIRPGLQCKCRTVEESLRMSLAFGKGFEMASCELPYKDAKDDL